MATTPQSAESAAASIWKRGEHEVSLARLYALRAVYLFFAIDGFLVTLPLLLDHSPERHLFLAVRGGLWIMGIVGVLHPLKVLPVPDLRDRLEAGLAALHRPAALVRRRGRAAPGRRPDPDRAARARARADPDPLGLCLAAVDQGADGALALK